MKRIAFMAHPVAGDIAANLARALRWLCWLIREYPELAIEVSWIAYCQALDDRDVIDRQRGLEDQQALLSRCDAIILVGGELTLGMTGELHTARVFGREVIDLLDLGPEPPPP